MVLLGWKGGRVEQCEHCAAAINETLRRYPEFSVFILFCWTSEQAISGANSGANFLMPSPRRFPGSLGILKVDLSERKRHSDDENSDEKRYKPPIGFFFVLRFTRPLRIGHRDALPFAVQ